MGHFQGKTEKVIQPQPPPNHSDSNSEEEEINPRTSRASKSRGMSEILRPTPARTPTRSRRLQSQNQSETATTFQATPTPFMSNVSVLRRNSGIDVEPASELESRHSFKPNHDFETEPEFELESDENEEENERILLIGQAVVNEVRLLFIYVSLFLLLDFALSLLNMQNGKMSGFIFFVCLVACIGHDLHFGPKDLPVHAVEAKMFLLARFVFGLFTLIFLFACFTDHFWSSVELEFEEEGKTIMEKHSDSMMLGPVYQGFLGLAKRTRVISELVQTKDPSAGSEGIKSVDKTITEFDIISTFVSAVVHGVVSTTKFVIMRLLILEAEMTVTMLLRFYSNL